MPLYDYRSRDDHLVVTLLRSVDDRNLPVWYGGQPLERVTVPDRIGVIVGSGRTELPRQGESVLRGYHEEECKHGSRFRSEFTPKQIREAWENDE